jgi:hypothetical protein
MARAAQTAQLMGFDEERLRRLKEVLMSSKTIDGGYIIAGNISAHERTAQGGICLIKTDSEGNARAITMFILVFKGFR